MGLGSLFRKKQRTMSIAQSLETSVAGSASTSMNRVQFEEELKQVFSKFDVNGDGKISSSELGSIFSSLGHTATEEELEKMIREVDKNGDGCLDLDEFIELNMKDIDSDEILESLKEAFSVFDIDKNGSITAEELQNVFKSLGDECSIGECRKMISGVDCDGDGMISFEEFKTMMSRGSRLDAMEAHSRGTLTID